jgi:hypothetical protein
MQSVVNKGRAGWGFRTFFKKVEARLHGNSKAQSPRQRHAAAAVASSVAREQSAGLSLLVARKRRAASELVSEQRCVSVLPRVRAARQRNTVTHRAGRACVWQRTACARRVRQRVPAARGRSSARPCVRQRAAARRGSVRGVAREQGRRSRRAKGISFARGARTAAAARERTGSVTEYTLSRQHPARAWAGRRRQAQT